MTTAVPPAAEAAAAAEALRRPGSPPFLLRPSGRTTTISPAFAVPVRSDQRRRAQNLAHNLRLLRSCIPKPNAHIPNARRCFGSVYPGDTHFDVQGIPGVSLRKFSPCGQYLVAFSKSPNVHSVYVFRLRRGFRPTAAPPCPKTIWSHHFERHFMTIVSHEPAALNKDFCLFSQQSRYLLLASKEPGQAPSPAAPRHVPMAADRIKDTVLHVIDMITGAIVSRREFRGDHINLTHNEGIYLHRNIIAVLRIATQEIELLRLGTDGTLSPLLSVGEFCHEDDRPFLARTAPSQTQPGPQIVPNLSASSAAGGSGQMVYGRPAPVRFDAAAAAAALANVNFNNSSGGAERGTVDASGGQ
eukprot:UC1_evm1s28